MQSVLAFLLLLASGSNETQEEFIRIWPEKAVVEYGGSVVLNCSSNCEGIGFESSLKQVSAGNGTSWKAFNFTYGNNWDPEILCFAKCTSAITPPRTKITVYRAPERVVLDPVPKMEVGQEYTLTCRVPNVAPIRNLTVILFKGQEKILVKTFENHTAPDAADVNVTHKITAQQNDHNAKITCNADLDLRPEGPRFEKAFGGNESLTTVVFPMDPSLETPHSAETNTKMTVNCNVSGVFPAEEVQFELLFAGERRNFSRRVSGDTVSAQALMSSSLAGEHKLICTVSLGPVTKTVVEIVNVYHLPKPILGINQPNILINQSVIINCSSDGTESPGTKMQIRDAKQTFAIGSPPFLTFPVKTREEDNGREFICRVELMVDGHPVVKETSVNLTVFYGPQMNDSSCPSMLTWKEGSEETFNCSAWGNPQPTVKCQKGSEPYSIGVQQHVSREHRGLYHCIATNAYGADVKNVTINVEFESSPLIILAIILPTLAVIGLVAAVICYKYYRSYKSGEYRISQMQQRRRRQQETIELKRLTGNIQTMNV
ncbi:intercellular adhesion molecule 5-like [Elgaria multicarinata webbii]|uniref:intercellular adhesion molecule 5-like n=1 Tax=Elgaria multicarinata webbii TaxID=159646 RepID=UPI002FCCD26D